MTTPGVWKATTAVALLDRHLVRATGSDQALNRYRGLLRELCLLALVLTLGCAVLVIGIVVVIRVVDLSPWVAGGVGVMGAGTAVAIGRVRDRRGSRTAARGRIPQPGAARSRRR